MLPPVLERLPQLDVVALLLRAGRLVPEPRAEPPAPREPRVHRRADAGRGRRPRRRVRRRRRPLLLRRRHRRVRAGRLRHRAPRAGNAREGAGREGDLRRAGELGCAARDRGSRRRALVNRVGHAFIKHRMRKEDALFARRGLRALLLPRLHAGRHGCRAVPRDARASLERRARRSRSSSRRSASDTSSPASSTRRSPTSR